MQRNITAIKENKEDEAFVAGRSGQNRIQERKRNLGILLAGKGTVIRCVVATDDIYIYKKRKETNQGILLNTIFKFRDP